MKIKLNDTAKMSLDTLIESRLLIQANSGGGKSHTIRRVVEQSFGHKQIIIIDPEGEFGNLRAKYDFVYCGKDGDAPADPRSASLLARRLLELKASAIIDLYEIPMERKRFVRLFLEALINAPKELWHDCLIIIDEAHVFAPEKSESEALTSVIDLASRGRKRGYCLIAATQRPAKLHKDVSAECNNKLIGRAVQDIDRKRSAEELGFTSKEEVLSLRDLEPGEFYAFGPAISRSVVKIKIGDVRVPPPKRGAAKKAPPKPSAKVKEILSQLSDLPGEAQKEATTIAELKKENAELKRHKCAVPMTKEIQDKWYETGFAAGKEAMRVPLETAQRYSDGLLLQMKEFAKTIEFWVKEMPEPVTKFSKFIKIDPEKFKKTNFKVKVEVENLKRIGQDDADRQAAEMLSGDIPEGEKKVLIAAIQYRNQGITRNQLTTVTGYKRSTRDAYIARLLKRGYVMFNGDRMYSTQEGDDALGNEYQELPTGQALRDHVMQTLPEGEKKVLYQAISARIDGHSGYVTRDWISEETGFKRSTRDAYIARLINRQLLESSSEGVRATEMLFTDL